MVRPCIINGLELDFPRFYTGYCVFSLGCCLAVSTHANDCLERLVSKITNMSSEALYSYQLPHPERHGQAELPARWGWGPARPVFSLKFLGPTWPVQGSSAQMHQGCESGEILPAV